MLEEGTRQLDLYDIVSILVPGAALAVGLIPFLPQRVDIPSTLAILLLLLISFIFGRGVAAIGIQIESTSRPTTHREQFQNEVISPSKIDRRLADRFFMASRSYFGLHELPQARVDLDENNHEAAIKSLYSHVRSFIHIDARGRSRTFQAILDFCRGMLVVSGLLFTAYTGYAIWLLAGLQQSPLAPYQSYIGQFEFNAGVMVALGLTVVSISYTVFERIRSNYREYYIQYLIVDFLVLLQHER